MNEKVQTINSAEMEILSEFPFEGDRQILERLRNVSVAYRLGILGDDFIIASQSDSVNNPKLNTVPPDATERFKLVIGNSIKRNWWSGNIAFELKNFDAILARLQEIYGARPARAIDLDEQDFANGKDKMSVRKNSVMPHNVGQPIVNLQITNYRRLAIDDSESDGWHLYVTPETGEKIMKEMQKIQPIVKARLQTNK